MSLTEEYSDIQEEPFKKIIITIHLAMCISVWQYFAILAEIVAVQQYKHAALCFPASLEIGWP